MHSLPTSSSTVFTKNELFKIHFCDTLEQIFAFFPDIYHIELHVKNKFNRPSLDVFPKLYLNPTQKLPGFILEPHYLDLDSLKELRHANKINGVVGLASSRRGVFKGMAHSHSTHSTASGVDHLSHASKTLKNPMSGLLLNWRENPKMCTLTVAQDFCNYIEFLEYLIFSMSEFDKEELECHIEEPSESKHCSFTRNQFVQHKNAYLGEDILVKQEKDCFSRSIAINEYSSTSKNVHKI